MRILGPTSHMVFCSLGKVSCQLRSPWREATCRSSPDTSGSRRAGRKVRKSETFWAFFERMSTGVHSPGWDLDRSCSSRTRLRYSGRVGQRVRLSRSQGAWVRSSLPATAFLILNQDIIDSTPIARVWVRCFTFSSSPRQPVSFRRQAREPAPAEQSILPESPARPIATRSAYRPLRESVTIGAIAPPPRLPPQAEPPGLSNMHCQQVRRKQSSSISMRDVPMDQPAHLIARRDSKVLVARPVV